MRIMSGNLEIHHVNMCFITLYTFLVNDSCSAKYSDIQNCFTGVVTLGLYVIYILLASAIYTCGLTIRYDSVYLTCSKKLTRSQLSPPHGTNKKLKCETKNKTKTSDTLTSDSVRLASCLMNE